MIILSSIFLPWNCQEVFPRKKIGAFDYRLFSMDKVKCIFRCSIKFINQVFGPGHEDLVEGHLENIAFLSLSIDR